MALLPATVAAGATATTLTKLAGTAADAVSYANAPTSLSGYTKSLSIVSRVYIDGLVYDLPVLPNLLKSLQVIYVSFIFSALQLNKSVTKEKTVQDFLRVIATEDLEDHVDIVSSFREYALEDAKEEREAWKHDRERKKAEIEDAERVKKTAEEERVAQWEREHPTVKTKDVTPVADGVFPTGRLIDVTLTNPDNPASNTTVSLLVQILPYVIPPAIVTNFIKLNAKVDIFMRWAQYKAGEISFWRDFVGNLDRVKEARKIVRNDKDGLLSDFLQHQTSQQAMVWWDIGKNIKEKKDKQPLTTRSSNRANTMLIFSQESILRAKSEVGVDITNAQHRQRYFDETMAIIIAVVDSMYNRVTLYFNGLDSVGTYSFDSFKTSSSKGDPVDLLQALAAMSKGSAPRF